MTEALLIIASLSAGVWAGWVIRSAVAQEERAEAYWRGVHDARTPGKVDQ